MGLIFEITQKLERIRIDKQFPNAKFAMVYNGAEKKLIQNRQ
jgi:hypothetical protein